LRPWLQVARSLVGKPNPDFAQYIRTKWPGTKAYLDHASAHEGNCGLFVAYCFCQVGIFPPFVPTSPERSFLRAFAWTQWGLPGWRTPGDVVVINRGGWHHVGFYLDERKGPDYWNLLCATQGPNREICEWYFQSVGCVAVRKPDI
jgi:hypothetical protein